VLLDNSYCLVCQEWLLDDYLHKICDFRYDANTGSINASIRVNASTVQSVEKWLTIVC